jgi:hypothetical protein
MDRNELYKMTKIYKGESDPPCIGNLTSLLWSAEKLWVECELPPELRDSEYLSYFTEDIEIMYNECKAMYEQTYGSKSLSDEIPIGLQSIIARHFIMRGNFTEEQMRQLFQDYIKMGVYYSSKNG